MVDDSISKLCSDYLRERYPGLKASHARELVAAFFGYKSHAALLTDKGYSIEDLGDAEIMIPSVDMIQERRHCLKDLANAVSSSIDIAYDLADFLQVEQLFTGEVWHCDDLGEFMMEEYLPKHLNPDLDLELEDVVAQTNAFFEEISYDDALVQEDANSVSITVTGTYSGYSNDGEEFKGDTIDMEVWVHMRRWAGRIAFERPEIQVEATVNQDYLNGEHDDSKNRTSIIAQSSL